MYRSKNIRLTSANYIGQQHYFITICCLNRSQIFTDKERCVWLLNVFRAECAARGFAVHAYCVMPDHFHFLAEGLQITSDLLNLVKSFKLKTSRNFSNQTGKLLWQRKFYDHILRPKECPESVAWYIWFNPVRKGLSATPQAYPFNGSFTRSVPFIDPPATIWVPPWREATPAEPTL